ncbi:hypothetical protein Ddc_16271 [Ditylenchus destructor]|nr:hypothetical protein Ddc_16271 [Ditylenchus destructor]
MSKPGNSGEEINTRNRFAEDLLYAYKHAEEEKCCHEMSLPRVHLGMQLDIFALFSRSELGEISKTNRRFNAIIEKRFGTLPCLVLGSLYYYDGKWKWSANVALEVTAVSMSDSQIAQLPSSKFLLFKESEFAFERASSAMEVLKTHKHLWEDGRLFVSMKSFMRSMEFASVVNTSKHLTLVVPGALRILSELLRGKCKHLVITDHSNNPTKQLPINDITNFFFSESECEAQSPCLAIKTRYSSKYQLEEEIIRGFEQKFMATALPPRFAFVKECDGDMDRAQMRDFTRILEFRPKFFAPGVFKYGESESAVRFDRVRVQARARQFSRFWRAGRVVSVILFYHRKHCEPPQVASQSCGRVRSARPSPLECEGT